MKTEIVPARTGRPSALYNGIQIHSIYDPEREARRIVDDACPFGGSFTVIVIGPGLGYIVAALRARTPASKIVALHLDAELHRRAQCVATHRWYPGHPEQPDAFLRSMLTVRDLIDLKVIVPRAMRDAFPEGRRRMEGYVRAILRELHANLTTIALSGQRWLKNAVVNFLFLERFIIPTPRIHPICIAASGPSLEESIADLVQARRHIELWALPSALQALLRAGLIPDMVVTVDGIHWAGNHLQALRSIDMTIAAPLTAARGMWSPNWRFLLLDQGFGPEGEWARLLAPACVTVPANGTVAGTALELARSLSAPAIVFAGLDLSPRDLHTHVRPHAFDHLLWNGASRLSPILTRLWSSLFDSGRRPEGASGVDSIYANWFRGRAEGRAEPLFRLRPSQIDLGMTPIDVGQLLRWQRRKPLPPPSLTNAKTSMDRLSLCRRVIADWRRRCTTIRGAVAGLDEPLHDVALGIAAQRYLLALQAERRSTPEAGRHRIMVAEEIDRFFADLDRRLQSIAASP